MGGTTDDTKLPDIGAFSTADGERLLVEFDTLQTFDDVNDWDARASRHVDSIAGFLSRLTATEAQVDATQQRGLEEAKNQSFLRRMLGMVPDVIKVARDWKARAASVRSALDDLVDRLQSAIDRTPNSRDEQSDMLRELKLAKKDLALQKREAAAAMRDISAAARRRSSQVGSGLGVVFSNSKSRRFSRMAIRLEKESAVKPHEDVRAHLERQILVVDRAIHWVERFK